VERRSDFHALLAKRDGRKTSFVIFDLLGVDGQDPRLRPIEALD
jgi:hypothetical protein